MYKLFSNLLTEMKNHAESCSPQECCGLLGGNSQVFTDYYPLNNRSERPQRQFYAAPEEVFKAMLKMRAMGQEELGIYHSHPQSIAYPSAKDVEMAFYPEAVHFILSLHPKFDLRAYQINKGTISIINFEVIA